METRGESIINSELQIITSMDLASRWPKRLAPTVSLATLRASSINPPQPRWSGTRYYIPSRSTVITVDYSHSNELVQPILQELINAYLAKHLETRSADPSTASSTSKRSNTVLAWPARKTNWRNALNRAGAFPEEAKADQNSKIASIRGATDSNAELASRQAMLEEMLSDPDREARSRRPDKAAPRPRLIPAS